jgi:hypothetical protein
MARISDAAMAEVTEAMDEYSRLVDESDLASTTRFAYTQNAQRFVRWLNGQYEIGPDDGTNGNGSTADKSERDAQSQGGKRGGSR